MVKKHNGSKGFTLIEILIGTVILGSLLTAIYSLFISANKSQISQDLEVEMQQNARSALEFIVREFKGMQALSCLENTTTTCPQAGDKIQFSSVNDTDSRLFSLRSADNTLLFSKKASLNPPDRQPLADHITTFNLNPFDANNSSTTEMGNVRRINITVTARTSRTDPNTKGYRSFSVTSSVTRRN
jgi:prepilin-type N-terminal cleavage/methylation domain-containing protein